MIRQKLTTIFHRVVDYFKWLPIRLWRPLDHVRLGVNRLLGRQPAWQPVVESQASWRKFGHWLNEIVIYLLECLGIGELYETLTDLIKWNTRALSQREIEVAKSVFGNTIAYHRIRIDEKAYLGPKQGRFCYVSFYLINSWGKMGDDLLIHELIHVWQYERLGAVYMPRALLAQRTAQGYNYGGTKVLESARAAGMELQHFNLEQQGDIIADYFRIKNDIPARWTVSENPEIEIFKDFVNDLNRK